MHVEAKLLLMKHLYETFVGKELSVDDVFEMDAIFEMFNREEILEEDAEMKLEKLLKEEKETNSSQEHKNT